MYKIDSRILGMVGTNCYLLCNMDIKECVLIDPADSQDEISRMIDESGCSLKGILLTHGHFDHIMGLDALLEEYPVPVYVHEAEKGLIADPKTNLSLTYTNGYVFEDATYVTDGQKIAAAGVTFEVLFTPGHTSGGCCYYAETENMLFSGDTLFRCSVGRSDLPTGDETTLIRSIKEKLLVLPENTVVYPGHMAATTIQTEKTANPFWRKW